MFDQGFLLYLAFGLLATPVLASLWFRERERMRWRRAVAVNARRPGDRNAR